VIVIGGNRTGGRVVVETDVNPVQDEVGGQKLGQLYDLDVLAVVLLQQPTVVVKFP
jgi:hypothetical protein